MANRDEQQSASESAPDGEPKGTPPRRRRWRRLALAGLVLLLLFALLIVFLPTLLSTSFGKERLLGVVRAKLAMPVELDSLELSWTGEQRLEGLRVGKPEGRPVEDSLLCVERVTVRSGLLGVVLSSGALAVEVEKPRVNLHRDADGRLNLPGKAGDESKDDSAPPPSEKGAGPPVGEIRLPEIPREIAIRVSDGELLYTDDALETAARLGDLQFALEASPQEAQLSVSAQAGPAGEGEPSGGGLELGGELKGLGPDRTLGDLEADMKGTLTELDLRPYRGLLADLAGWTPPDKPVSGEFTLKTEDGMLRATSELDAGMAEARGVRLEVPLRSPPAPASVVVPWQVDVGATAASLLSAAAREKGTQIRGQANGTLEISGPLSLESLSEQGIAGLENLALTFAVDARDLHFEFPPRKESGAEAPKAKDEADTKAEPLVFAEKNLTLKIQLTAADVLRKLKLEGLELASSGLKASLQGSAERHEGDAGGKDASGWGFGLQGSIEAALPELVTQLQRWLPEDLEIGPQSTLRFGEIQVQLRPGGSAGFLSALDAKTRLEAAGDVKLSGVQLQRLDGDLNLAGGELSFSKVNAVLNRGKLSNSEVVLGLGKSPLPFKVALEVDGAAANQALAPALAYVVPFLALEGEKAELAGAIQAKVTLEGQGFALAELKESLTGGGELRIREGHVSASRFFHELAGLVGANLDKVAFAELGSDFQVSSGKISVGELSLTGSKGSKLRKLGLNGVVTLDRGLDFGVNLDALGESIGDDKIRRILGQASKVLGQDTLPLKLGGTLDAPSLELKANALAPSGLDVKKALDFLK